MLILALMMALAVGLTTAVTMDSGLRGAFNRSTAGFYAAESGLNRGMGDFRNKFLSFQVPSGSDFSPHTFILGSRTVNYQLSDVAGNPQLITIPSGQVFGGLNSLQYTYIDTATAVKDGSTEADVGAEFDVGYIPLFQFIAFYSNDLEIMPGADMHLHGRVHTNGNLYLNSDAHLYIEDNQGPNATAAGIPQSQWITTVQVTAKGDVYRGRKNTTACTGTVTVDKLEDKVAPTPDLDALVMSCNGGTSKVPVSTLSAWKGSIVSQIQSISVPQPDIVAKGTGGYWTNADLRVVLQFTGAPPYNIVVENVSGTVDAAKTALLAAFMADTAYNTGRSSWPGTRPIFYTDVPLSGAGCGCSDANPGCNNNATRTCYNPPLPTSNNRVYGTNGINMLGDFDYRRGGFYNNREHKWMYLLNINLHDLLDWNMQQAAGARFFDPADTTDGGIVFYATIEGPDSNTINNYGVRIFGSGNLPFPAVPAGGDPTGVTVVSDQAIYTVGNYNSVAPKQPAAIIGDSVNVLSNNYFVQNTAGIGCANDCQSALSLSNRPATSTTLNTAFLGGVDTTTPANYNGGLENYPRFHESWSGQTLNYRGSFVSLGTPQHVDGAWCGTGGGCNIYNPPARNYDYDPDFNDVKNLPPMTPRFVYVQQVLFTENFK